MQNTNTIINSIDYKILERIGQGTFGCVYKALHVPSEQKVAIKVINIMMPNRDVLRRHLLMIARELYILCQLTALKQNCGTITLIDTIANPEAYEATDKLTQLCMVSHFETTDLETVIKNKTEMEYE